MLRGLYYITFIAQIALSKVLINVTELIRHTQQQNCEGLPHFFT